MFREFAHQLAQSCGRRATLIRKLVVVELAESDGGHQKGQQ